MNIKTEWILAFTKGRRQTEAFDEEKLRCWLGYEKSYAALITESLLKV